MTTTDSVILAREASAACTGGLAFDLGTGAGEVPRLVSEMNGSIVWIGLDTCPESLRLSRGAVLPVLAGVGQVPALFPVGIADLVTANPPYFVSGSGRPSPDPAREGARRGGGASAIPVRLCRRSSSETGRGVPAYIPVGRGT